jgi:hypothetical protein
LEEQERPLLQVKIPKHEEVEVYLIKLADGRIVARTKEELEKAPLPSSSKGAKAKGA